MEKVTIAILDYNRPEEAKNLLVSLKKNAQFEKHILYLDNGSDEIPFSNLNPHGYQYRYSNEFLNEGLIDELIINQYNSGCGAGMEQLYHCSRTKYVMLVQVDQYLQYKMEQNFIDNLIRAIYTAEYQCIDLAGDQGHGKFSDRAHLMTRELYLSIPKSVNGEFGGPGPFNHLKYTEEFVGDYFIANKLKIAHLHTPFVDAGMWSVRQLMDGTRTKHRTDTKELWFLDKPTQKNPVFPNLTDEEWNLCLTSGWPDGKIPERELEHSFMYWK